TSTGRRGVRATIFAEENRRWWTLGALCFALFMIMLDNTVVNVALPAIKKDLGVTQAELEWTVAAYALTFASLLLTGGQRGDHVGGCPLLDRLRADRGAPLRLDVDAHPEPVRARRALARGLHPARDAPARPDARPFALQERDVHRRQPGRDPGDAGDVRDLRL